MSQIQTVITIATLVFNDQLFFEMLLLEIRGKTISYSSYLKKQTKHTEENILKEIADRLSVGVVCTLIQYAIRSAIAASVILNHY